MTDKKTEALKLALDALENSRSLEPVDVQWVKGKRHAAITSIREALAEQPAQPIRWDSNAVDMTGAMATLPKSGSESVVDYKPVISDAGAAANTIWPEKQFSLKGTGKITVTSPPASKPWVGLTDQEIQWIYVNSRTLAGMIEMAEAKLREKNGA